MVFLENVGLGCKIIVNGSAAQEYLPYDHLEDVENDDIMIMDDGSYPSCALRYIESLAGADFFIYVEASSEHPNMRAWLDASDENTVKFEVLIDGEKVGGTWVTARDSSNTLRGINDHAAGTRQKFRFAVISLSEFQPLLNGFQLTQALLNSS